MLEEPTNGPDAEDAGTAGRRASFGPRRRWLIRLAGLPLAAYGLTIGIMWAFEDRLIYFPSVYPQGDWAPNFLRFEDAWFESSDAIRLHGWYVAHPSPRAVVLFAHGNAGNLSHRAAIVADLVDHLHISVLIFDYRGYGRSDGSPSERGLLADARAARSWLARRAGVDESQIVLLGESLGGGVMVDLAANDGARALVLENTFDAMPNVAAFHFPWLPVKMLMRTRFDSVAKIGRYQGALLQFHGDADTVVPLASAERLFEAANQPKQFVKIPGGDHNDPPTAEFFQALDEFLHQLPVTPVISLPRR